MLTKNILRKNLAVLGGIRQLQQVIDVVQLDAELGGEAVVAQRSASTGIGTCRIEGLRRKRRGHYGGHYGGQHGGQHGGGGRRSSGQGSRGAGGRPRGGGRGHRFRRGGSGCSGGRSHLRSGSRGDAREGIGQGPGGAGHQRPRSTAKEGVDDWHCEKEVAFNTVHSHYRPCTQLGSPWGDSRCMPLVCPLHTPCMSRCMHRPGGGRVHPRSGRCGAIRPGGVTAAG